METPIKSTTQAAERILAILNEKPQYLENAFNALESLDNWQWATDTSNDIPEVI